MERRALWAEQRHQVVVRDQDAEEDVRLCADAEQQLGELGAHERRHAQNGCRLQQQRRLHGGRVQQRAHHAVRAAEQPARVV